MAMEKYLFIYFLFLLYAFYYIAYVALRKKNVLVFLLNFCE